MTQPAVHWALRKLGWGEGGKSTCDLTTTSPCQEVEIVRADRRTLEGD